MVYLQCKFNFIGRKLKKWKVSIFFYMRNLVSTVNYEKLQFEHAQKLYILNLGMKKCFQENFVNIAKVSWENSQEFELIA